MATGNPSIIVIKVIIADGAPLVVDKDLQAPCCYVSGFSCMSVKPVLQDHLKTNYDKLMPRLGVGVGGWRGEGRGGEGRGGREEGGGERGGGERGGVRSPKI